MPCSLQMRRREMCDFVPVILFRHLQKGENFIPAHRSINSRQKWLQRISTSLDLFLQSTSLIVILNILFAAELHQILSRDRHPSYSAEFYSSYVNILLGVFYSVCRDLRELRHLVRSLTRSTPRRPPHLTNDFFPLFSRRRSTSQSSASRCRKDEVNYEAGAFVHLTADQILKRPFFRLSNEFRKSKQSFQAAPTGPRHHSHSRCFEI